MDLRVQLKVCEGCGCLWYRKQTENCTVYCAGCTIRLRDFPQPLSRGLRGRPRKLGVPRMFAVAEAGGAQ